MSGAMPRKVRIEYPGAMYHLMSRGDRREKSFLDDVDGQDFVKTLAEACRRTGWQVHAYCLNGTCTAICTGAKPSARDRGNWGYDQRRNEK
jgi:hypothetical protein